MTVTNFQDAVEYLRKCGFNTEIGDAETSSFNCDELLYNKGDQDKSPDHYFVIFKQVNQYHFHESTQYMSQFTVTVDTLQLACEIPCKMYATDKVFSPDFTFPTKYQSQFEGANLHFPVPYKTQNSLSFFVGTKNLDMKKIVHNFQYGTAEEMLEAEGQLLQNYNIWNSGKIIGVDWGATMQNSGLIYCSANLDKIVDALCEFQRRKDKSFDTAMYL